MNDITDQAQIFSLMQDYSIWGVIVYVLVAIALWKVFSKAGYPGILAIIPIVNVFVLVKVAGYSASVSYTHLDVYKRQADDVEGVVYLRDASGFQLRRPEEASTALVTRIMKPAMFVPELQRADELLRQMQREANHLALVVDEYGGISGLVTLEDLIEELLGEINDEHDRETHEVEPQADGTFKVSARLPVDRLGEIFGIEL